MEKGKVSIIVPIYNVEKYLERCLMSLVSQTYTHIEILLINDGSTDHSGEICRNFADHYPQIRYFEKENEGPSIARNFGIQKAVGEFLSFVDSDDYIEQEMIERMLLCAQRENAQLVMCSYRIDYRFGVLYRKAPKYKVWKKEEALHALLRNDSVNNFAWGKLFRRDLFDGLLFPACRFEDVFTIFQTFLKAETIVTMPERFYHYFQRKGSIMNKDGLLALDMDIVLEMRAAFEYQEREVRKAYPSEKFSNRYNYYTTDMLIIYTMIMFVKRKDAVRYPLPKLNLEGLPLFYRLTYRLWVFIARMKFGRYLRIVSEGA